jgi:flagellar protein FlaD
VDVKRPLVDDWRLTIEDHLKSLIFIERIRGTEVNKDKLEDLERDIENLRKGLEGFFGL